ncbi:MAG: sulfatase [Puniceicoccaceae bacterium]
MNIPLRKPTWLILFSLLCVSLSATQRNIVLFLIDDLGWNDIGANGSTYYQTPAIDSLARDGVNFTQAYSACAVCTPSRAAILTGRYPARILMTNWTPDGRWNPANKYREGRFVRDLPLEEFTIAEALREAGYKTISVGKWHLGGEPFSMPEHHGFDINIGGTAHGAPGEYFYPYAGNWSIPTTGTKSKWNVFSEGEPGEYLTDRLTDEAINFIKDNRDEPFFLYFPHFAVHTPLEAKEEMIRKYKAVPEDKRQGDPIYAAMVESVDVSVSRVMETLEELDLDENTVVIFTSDNGGMWKATDNSPLRGHKGTYWEGGIRVPLIIKWPGYAKRGKVVDAPVIGMDLYPTLLEIAGLPMRPSQHLDGVNLAPLLKDVSTLQRQSLFWHFPHYNNHPETVPQGAILKGPWKLIESFDPEGLQLYNLEDDPSESRNLIKDRSQVASRLLKELKQWRKDVDADLMKTNPDYNPEKAQKVKKLPN